MLRMGRRKTERYSLDFLIGRHLAIIMIVLSLEQGQNTE